MSQPTLTEPSSIGNKQPTRQLQNCLATKVRRSTATSDEVDQYRTITRKGGMVQPETPTQYQERKERMRIYSKMRYAKKPKPPKPKQLKQSKVRVRDSAHRLQNKLLMKVRRGTASQMEVDQYQQISRNGGTLQPAAQRQPAGQCHAVSSPPIGGAGLPISSDTPYEESPFPTFITDNSVQKTRSRRDGDPCGQSAIIPPSPLMNELTRFQACTEYSLKFTQLFTSFLENDTVLVHHSDNIGWVTGVVVAVYTDGSYGVQFLDMELSEGEAGVIQKQSTELKPYQIQYRQSDESVDSDSDSVSMPGEDDEDYIDGDDSLCCSPRKKAPTQTQEETMIAALSRIATSLATRSFWIPERKQTHHRTLQPRLQVGTILLLNAGVNVFGVECVQQGTITQILRCAGIGSLDFHYIIQSKRHDPVVCDRIVLESTLCQEVEELHLHSVVAFPDGMKSMGSGKRDIYREIDPTMFSNIWAPHTISSLPFPRRQSRQLATDQFSLRLKDTKWIETQQSFLDALQHRVIEQLPIHLRPARLDWGDWTSAKPGERWYVWQLTVLLEYTSNVGDKIVKETLNELFGHTSNALAKGEHFDNPISVAKDPIAVFMFLTDKAKMNDQARKIIKEKTGNKDVTEYENGVSKGMNHCFKKATYVCLMSQQLVLFHYLDTIGQCVFKANHKLDYSAIRDVSLRNRIEGSFHPKAPLEPLPVFIIDYAENLSEAHTLFPRAYSDTFFRTLMGIGLKMRHLIAEKGYGINVGPAIDCHMIRFTVNVGTGYTFANIEQLSNFLLRIYRVDQMPWLNEVPASIAQILGDRSDQCMAYAPTLIILVQEIATEFGLQQCITNFMEMYPPPTTNL
jgi:hypothetical protein